MPVRSFEKKHIKLVYHKIKAEHKRATLKPNEHFKNNNKHKILKKKNNSQERLTKPELNISLISTFPSRHQSQSSYNTQVFIINYGC